MKIHYYNRYTERIQKEHVYGEKAIQWMYQSFWGRICGHLLTIRPFSIIYGLLQSLPSSKKKIQPFVEKFHIPLQDYLPQEGRDQSDPYSSFNHFFIRRFRPEKRVFVQSPYLAAFSEGRYFGHECLDYRMTVPVKGECLSIEDLLKKEKWSKIFQRGPILISRLCPTDYHRFHFPDKGRLLDHYPICGKLHSVNPMALREYASILSTNRRSISILETDNFGKLAYIEVGAICVGNIIQTHKQRFFERGDEKGYFLFGGSTVILIGQKGKWRPCNDILQQTKMGRETYIHLGDSVGQRPSI